jgi:hypothetical protein
MASFIEDKASVIRILNKIENIAIDVNNKQDDIDVEADLTEIINLCRKEKDRQMHKRLKEVV